MRFTIFQESRKGSRKVNQDRIAYTFSRDTLLLVVADGMGGHAGGEIAAQIAVRLFIERFQQEAKPLLKNPLKFLQDTMLRAHAALTSYANQFSMLETPRTTCVACIVQANHAYWCHVGDSRLYLFRQGGLIGSTKDHSKVQYLVDQGIIGADEVMAHPDRNKIFSCLGGLVDPVIDLSRRTPLRNGDILVLCTDGLWDLVSKRELVSIIQERKDLTKACLRLIRLANARGGHDNITVAAARFGRFRKGRVALSIIHDLDGGGSHARITRIIARVVGVTIRSALLIFILLFILNELSVMEAPLPAELLNRLVGPK